MNYLQIDQAVRNRADWSRTILVPECPVRYKLAGLTSFAEYFADYMGISEAGYATELEVKVSRSDWRVDRVKQKWGNLPSWISRFIYVVPQELGIPEWVPEFAGVWHLRTTRVRHRNALQEVNTHAEVVRAPRRLGKEKVPEKLVQNWMRGFYFRYWRQRIDRHPEKMAMLHQRAPGQVHLTKVPEGLSEALEL